MEESRRLARIGMRVRDHAKKITGDLEELTRGRREKKLTHREESQMRMKQALDRELKAAIEHDVLQEIIDEEM